MDVNWVLYGIATIGSILFFKKIFLWYKSDKRLKQKLQDVKNRKVGLIQKFEGMKLPFENKDKLCQLSGDEIRNKVKSGELSSVNVLEAYQANALVKNSEFNFIADVIYEADVSSLLIDPQSDCQILGFPLSVSDSLSIDKYDCTLGLSSEILQPSSRDSLIVKILRENGAIPTIITNIGQGDFIMETSNPIFGQTLNPFNSKRSPGGSSGGVAVSLALNCCLVGIANDLNGNIRIPASFCNVFGFKPTSLRISQRYKKQIGFRQSIIEDSIGPLARNVNDLVAIFKSMTSSRVFELDPSCPPVPFNNSSFSSKEPLRLGYYVHIGANETYPIPAVERAVYMAKNALEKAGHTVVPFELPTTDYIVNKVYRKIEFSDGGESLMNDVLKDGPIDASLKPYTFILKCPTFFRRFLGFVTGLVCKSSGDRLSSMAGASSVYELWKLKQQIVEYQNEVLTNWEKENLDGLICPVLPIVAPPLKDSGCLVNDNAYTVIFNILNYPAGSVPVTKANQKDIDDLQSHYSKKSKCCGKIAKNQLGTLGMPVGVQCVALPWNEETALRIMKDLHDNL